METQLFSTASILLLNQDTKFSDIVREFKRRGIRLATEKELNVAPGSHRYLVCGDGKVAASRANILELSIWNPLCLNEKGMVPAGTMIPFKRL